MPITLAEASFGRADKVTQKVIDTLRRGSQFIDELTFDDCVSPGVGGSTMTYGYLQLQTPSTAAGRAINSDYTANEPKGLRKVLTLKFLVEQVKLTVWYRRQQQTRLRSSLSR